MPRLASRPGFAPAVAGTVLVAELAAARLLFDATTAGVTFRGRALPWYCAVRTELGVPCPTCGITRGVILTVHGHVADAWSLSPGSVAAVTGMLLIAAALLLLGWRQSSGGGRVLAGWIRRFSLAGAGAVAAVWICGWAVALASALRLR